MTEAPLVLMADLKRRNPDTPLDGFRWQAEVVRDAVLHASRVGIASFCTASINLTYNLNEWLCE